jgi:hypothetical protein
MLLTGYEGPGVEAIRILALEPLPIEELQADNRESADILRTGSHWQFRIVRQGLCSEKQALSVEELWNALPPGDVARCHLPGFALQFFARNEIAFTAALCWQCNNISYAGVHAPIHRLTFDGRSRDSDQLLRICKTVTNSAGL